MLNISISFIVCKIYPHDSSKFENNIIDEITSEESHLVRKISDFEIFSYHSYSLELHLSVFLFEYKTKAGVTFGQFYVGNK